MYEANFFESDKDVMVVCKALECLSDIVKNHDRELTLRCEMRYQFDMAAKLIDAKTDIIKKVLEINAAERQKIIAMIAEIGSREVIDESVINFVEKIYLVALKETNPIKALEYAPQNSLPMLGGM